MLTVRAFQIANKMLIMKRSIRIKDLSVMFHVSERTIKYDLEHIRCFFENFNLEVRSQSGKGIWIDCSDQKREEMVQTLAKLQQENLYYNQSMRVHRILLYLFLTDGFVTAGELADYLNVNRNTILNDIDTLCEFLQETDIRLERKPRMGYRLTGREQDLRYFFEVQIQKSLSVYDVYLMTERMKYKNFDKPIRINLPKQYTKNYHVIEAAMHKLFYEEKHVTENVILIMIRLMISLVRVPLGRLIGETVSFDDAKQKMHYLSAYWAELYQACELPVYRDEIYYLEGRQEVKSAEVDIAAFTMDLIKKVSEKNEFPYYEDSALYSRILSHLTLSLKEDIKENPFNNSIRKNHAALFLAVREVCQKFLQNNPLIYNDSFISYIVLHFLVSQRNIRFNQKLKAVFVCATGRGAAKLIEKMLEHEIREIEMVANCSLVEAEKVIKALRPDYVISVFPIEASVPVIVVEPVPTKENIDFIKALVKNKRDESLLAEDKFDQMLDFNLNADAEGISQQVIMKGLQIYNQLKSSKELSIKEGLDFAFLTHCMLLAHRHHFDKQYQNFAAGDESDQMKRVRDLLGGIGVHINANEIQALLNYYK